MGAGPGGEDVEFELEYSQERVRIEDGRPDLAAGRVSLERTGCVLIRHHTALTTADFYSSVERIRTVYYEEMCRLVQEATGAQTVIAMTHQVRNESKALELLGGDKTKIPRYKTNAPDVPAIDGYAVHAHADFSDKTAARTAREQLYRITPAASRKAHARGRYVMINAWRNISESEPIRNHHLAMLDGSTLCLEDIVLVDMYYDTFSSECVQVTHRSSARHRWLYFPDMRQEEVLLFKQYDSDRGRAVRYAVHCAFEDPAAPAAAAPRQSIEVRVLCFFPDGGGDAGGPGEGGGLLAPGSFPPAAEVGRALLGQLASPELWPEDMRRWLRAGLARDAPAAAAELMALMVAWNADPENPQGLIAGAPEELREAVLAWLRASDFEGRLRANFAG